MGDALVSTVLPLALGSSGYRRLMGTPHQAIFDKGVRMALENDVLFQDEEQRELFHRVFSSENS